MRVLVDTNCKLFACYHSRLQYNMHRHLEMFNSRLTFRGQAATLNVSYRKLGLILTITEKKITHANRTFL